MEFQRAYSINLKESKKGETDEQKEEVTNRKKNSAVVDLISS